MKLRRSLGIGIGLAAALVAHASGDADFATIYEFPGGAHGLHPEAGVILGPAGSVFGTTDSDGISAGGVVFQLSPPQVGGRPWNQRVIKRFHAPTEGGYPLGLTWTSSGALYGVTLDGGASSGGTVFRLQPPAPSGALWTFTVLHQFAGGYDGALPSGSLIVEHGGALSGTTILGGAGPGLDGYGTVFTLRPASTTPGRWTETIAHRFTSTPDGATPGGGLLSDDAERYGVTTTGGTGICSNVGCGTIYRLRRGTDGASESVIYQFVGGADGSVPVDRLVADRDGSLYGATAQGGLPGPNGQFLTGTVFRLDPPHTASAQWTKTILYQFKGGADGYVPQGGVTLDAAGTLYGTTEFGGAYSAGTVFKLTPNAGGQLWAKTILHDFAGGAGDGANPIGHVTLDTDGAIFGTTYAGGAANDGTVYRITP